MTLSPDELELIEVLKSKFLRKRNSEILLGIGDDAAVLKNSLQNLVATSDTTTDGIHADLRFISPLDFGWKAITRAVSDISVMGCVAKYLLVKVVAPSGFNALEQFFEGVHLASSIYATEVIGGDISLGLRPSPSVFVLGDTFPNQSYVTRSGAKAGELIFLTKKLGLAAKILKDLGSKRMPSEDELEEFKRPIAQVIQGVCANKAKASAMCDISDGLALDLDRVAVASCVGFSLNENFVAKGPSLNDALYGGDDYALVFCAPDRQAVVREFEDHRLDPPVETGVCVSDPTQRLLAGKPLKISGFIHKF